MCMLDEIRARRDEIYAIARKHKAEKLWVFGFAYRVCKEAVAATLPPEPATPPPNMAEFL